MRVLFNNGQYYERALAKLLRMVTESDKPAPRSAGQRHGMRSQIVAYWDGAVKVCIVHQYWHRHTGTGGGSGLHRPDPQMIFENGVIYKLDKSEP